MNVSRLAAVQFFHVSAMGMGLQQRVVVEPPEHHGCCILSVREGGREVSKGTLVFSFPLTLVSVSPLAKPDLKPGVSIGDPSVQPLGSID